MLHLVVVLFMQYLFNSPFPTFCVLSQFSPRSRPWQQKKREEDHVHQYKCEPTPSKRFKLGKELQILFLYEKMAFLMAPYIVEKGGVQVPFSGAGKDCDDDFATILLFARLL